MTSPDANPYRPPDTPALLGPIGPRRLNWAGRIVLCLDVFAFVYYWNAYLWPLTVLSGREAEYPIVLKFGRLLSYTRSAENTNLVMAGAVLAVLTARGVRLPTAILRAHDRP